MRISDLHLAASKRGIAAVTLERRAGSQRTSGAHLDRCRRELAEYLSGDRTRFTAPLDLAGTAFQRTVWSALASVPYGSTMTYGELARKIGRPSAVRAVASAVARNPIGIIIPCHRIVPAYALRASPFASRASRDRSAGRPASRRVGKYAWGSTKKKWLLKHERSSYAPLRRSYSE